MYTTLIPIARLRAALRPLTDGPAPRLAGPNVSSAPSITGSTSLRCRQSRLHLLNGELSVDKALQQR
jgi:hypothetical protein